MSTSTGVVNEALIFIVALSVLLLVLITFFLVYFAVRYRSARNPVPAELPENPLIETTWVVIPTIIALIMFFYGLTGFVFMHTVPAGSIKVKVHARQWSWLFEYDDGKKSPDLIVPYGKDVSCELISEDVIHGFYIPSFRIQQDAVPGLSRTIWFNATSLGSFYILCSQYCGQKHSAMIANLYVVPVDQYDAWRKGKHIELSGNALKANMPPGQALLFERGCMSCHSLTGGSMVGPSLKGLFGSNIAVVTQGRQRTVVADSAYISTAILQPGADVTAGFPNTMPPGGTVLSQQEIGEIIAFLKTLK